MTITEIVIKAIPRETCPVKNAAAMNRRELLRKRINDYLSEQLSQQFNAKPVSPEFKLRLGESRDGRITMQ